MNATGQKQTLAGCFGTVWKRTDCRPSFGTMTASPPPPIPPMKRALIEVREILERARRTGNKREIEAAIERINVALDKAD